MVISQQSDGSFPAETAVYLKMTQIMGEIEAIKKDAAHPQGWRYVSASAVADEIRKLMAAHHLAFLPRIAEVQSEEKRWVIRYAFTLACAETGATVNFDWYGEAQKYTPNGYVDDKSLAKASTTAAKYFLLRAFMVSTEDDPDGDTNVAGTQQERRSDRSKQRRIPQPEGEPLTAAETYLKSEDGRQRLRKVLDECGYKEDNSTTYLSQIEPGKVLTKFGQTTLSETALHKRIREISAALQKPATPKTHLPAEQPAQQPAYPETGEVTATAVTYVKTGSSSHLTFHTSPVVWAYGRSSTFKQWVGDAYYEANHFEDMTAGKRHTIAALTITYEAKQRDDGTLYYVATGATPVEAVPEVPEIDPLADWMEDPVQA